MSGQFPNHHQAGGTPVTMDNFSGWSHSPHQQSHDHNVPPGAPQSTSHGMLPQSHIPPFGQVPSSPSKATKFPNLAHNGGGVGNQHPQTNLSENLRQNFNLYMNQVSGQPSKLSSINSMTQSVPTLSGSIDLSQAPRTGDNSKNESIVVVAPHKSKESSLPSQNCSVISSAGMSGPPNGESNPRTVPVVSVISNTSTSNKRPSDLLDHGVSGNQDSRGKEPHLEAQTEGTKIGEVVTVSPGMNMTNCSVIAEPAVKKFKKEGSSNSAVIVDSSNSAPLNVSNIASQDQMCNNQEKPTALSNSLAVPGLNTSSKQDVLDVESQLEALFAGIADDENSSKDSKPVFETSVNIQGTPNVAAVLESKGSSSKKGKGKVNGVTKSNDVFGMSSTESTPKKKRKKKPTKDKPWEDSKRKKSKKGGAAKGKYVKEASCDSGSNASSSRTRGPVVHLEGPKDAPTSLAVINAPARQDDEDNDGKKKALSSSRIRKGHAVEGKLSSTGLCGNSLVSRYESHSSDPRWVCVFCKKGCHVEGLGDLFGPYLVNHDIELENSLDTSVDRKSGDKKDKKNKRSGVGQTGVLGLLAIPPLVGEQPQFMVWFHENCAVWSPTINLIGSRLTGLQEAVWVAVHSKCNRCLLDGANLGCVHHGCSRQVHFPCAQDESWSLDVDTFISTCHIHKKLVPTHTLSRGSIL